MKALQHTAYFTSRSLLFAVCESIKQGVQIVHLRGICKGNIKYMPFIYAHSHILLMHSRHVGRLRERTWM